MIDDHDRCEWVNVFFWYWLTQVVPNKVQRAVKQLCVCVLTVTFLLNWSIIDNVTTCNTTAYFIGQPCMHVLV